VAVGNGRPVNSGRDGRFELPRELEEFGMAISEEDVVAALSGDVMPRGLGIVHVAIGMPRAVALDDLVGGADGDLRGADRRDLRVVHGGGDVLDPERVDAVLRPVAA